MRTYAWRGLLAVALVAFSIGSASASPILGGATGLASPTSTITFDELGNLQNVAISNQFAGLGVTFSPGFLWDNALQGQAGSTGFAGGDLQTPNAGAVVTMTFSGLRTGVAFAAVDQDGTFTIESFLGASLVESFSILIPQNPGIGFIGFQNSLFNSIRITSPGTSRIAIDTLQQRVNVNVPEPATLLMLGAGLAVGAVRRRRLAR